MQKKIVTFGEILMRLNPEGYFRFLQSSKFEVSYGGGEANVAVSLANYGMNATFVSKVPEHEIGQCAINELRRYGVDTKFVARGGNRLGVYFCEKGASQRVSKVIYDRENSSISQADPEDFNWDLIFDKADWFHWTGITPARFVKQHVKRQKKGRYRYHVISISEKNCGQGNEPTQLCSS